MIHINVSQKQKVPIYKFNFDLDVIGKTSYLCTIQTNGIL